MLVAATGCLALDPNYWNCDESPYISHNIGPVPDGEFACDHEAQGCEYRVGQEESIQLWGQTCDAFYTHEITEVRVDPPLAEWRIESVREQVWVVFVPTETGTATLSLEYEYGGSSKEFQREIMIVADDQ
tara:strand:+ start:18107 stop:18496 length:390 start_codon:yes stop_codon:yes gene_type:complete